MSVNIQLLDHKIQVSTPVYSWEWDAKTDFFELRDNENRIIGHGPQRPLIITRQTGWNSNASINISPIDHDRVSISYHLKESGSRLTVTWSFHPDFISLEPLLYEAIQEEEILQIVYFADAQRDSYKPAFYSRYAVVPGLSMSTNISPVIDLHSRLSVTAVLGSGAMRGPGLTQQWGLPAHYFCTFNTADRWNAIGAKKHQSGAACWGLAELPAGDFRLDLREIGLSPVLNLRSDLWKQFKTPGAAQLGFSFLITFGANFHEAIRKYYQIVMREKIIQPKTNSGGRFA